MRSQRLLTEERRALKKAGKKRSDNEVGTKNYCTPCGVCTSLTILEKKNVVSPGLL